MKPLSSTALPVFFTLTFALPAHAAILEPSDLQIYNHFGWASSISGSNVLVSSPDAASDPTISHTGAGYLFRGVDSATGKVLENVRLLASDREFGSSLGYSASLSGSIGLLGAYAADEYRGAAYLFRNLDSASGTVTEHAKLVTSSGQRNTLFGISSSISNDNALVGASNATGRSARTGAAFLYRNISTATGTVREDVKLAASDGSSFDNFGFSVSLSGSTALVGAMSDRSGDGPDQGSAYVFRNLHLATGTVTENAKLVASDAAPEDFFGESVHLEGTTGFVSARGHDNGSTADQGAVYIYRNLDSVTGTVTEDAKLMASDGKFNEGFGGRVSVSGENALVSTRFLNGGDASTLSTAIYLFTGLDSATGVVNETLKLSVSSAPLESYGVSIGLSGENFVIGYSGASGTAEQSGAAFTGTLNTMLTLDAGNVTRATDGLSFASRTDWIVGKTTSGNQITVVSGDKAEVISEGRGVYIGQEAGADSNVLNVAGTLVTNHVRIGSGSGNSGNKLHIGGGGVVDTTLIVGAGSGLVSIDGGTVRLRKSGEAFSGFLPGQIMIEDGGLTLDSRVHAVSVSSLLDGEGGLTKTGQGSLVLTAGNTYQGETRVREGSLVLNNISGSATGSGKVRVMTGGLLSGVGSMSGDLLNYGTVAPGNSPGALHVGGDFKQSTGATLEMEIGKSGEHDVLAVEGKVSLGGTLRIDNALKLGIGQKFQLITADEGFSGDFDNVILQNSGDSRIRFIARDSVGTIHVAPKVYSQLAVTENELAVASVLDNWIGSASGDTRTVSENLDSLSAEGYRAAFQMLSPSLYAAGVSTALEQGQSQSTALGQHLDSRRLRPSVPNDAENPWEAWAISTGSYSPGSMSSLEGDDYSAGNFIAGIEREITPGITAGIFNSYGESEGDFSGSSEIEQERFTLGAHATAQFGGTYASTALGFGTLEMDVHRSIRIGGLSREARSETDGKEFFAMISGGHDFRQGSWVFGPTASLQYS
ncbi:MAG: autotransporter domain-containing protein, partial [Verrucomicrobiaceae bacterium]